MAKKITKKTSKKKTEEVAGPTQKEKLESYLKQANKDHGDNIVIGFADKMDLDYGFMIPPFPALAQLMGRDDGTPGGFPYGKVTVISGPERSGKTTLCLQTLASEMAKFPDQFYVWIDAELSFDEAYAEKLGIDLSRLIILRSGTMQDILDRVIEMCKQGLVNGVILDSLGGLTPEEEIYDKKTKKDHSLSKDHMLWLQRKLPQFLRMLSPFIGESKIPLVLIAHVYQDIGGYGGYVVKGGNGLKHWGHVRLMVSRLNDTKQKRKVRMPDGEEKEVFIGHNVVVKLDKTRQNSREAQSVVIPYRQGVGLDAVESTIAVAINIGIVEQSGAWYNYGKDKMQGRKGVSDYFADNKEAYNSLLDDLAVYHEVQRQATEEIETEDKELIINESIA